MNKIFYRFFADMDKIQTLHHYYEDLQQRGIVIDKKDFARQLGVNYSNLVCAYNGNERMLTDRLLAKISAFYNEKTGQPADMPAPEKTKQEGVFIPRETLDLYTSLARSCETLSALVDRLTGAMTAPQKSAAFLDAQWRAESKK